MKIEIWSDVVCPWCYIGKRRFETAIEAYEEETGDDVDVVFMPFMLDPTAPADAQPVRAAYEKKFGGPLAAKEILDRVTSEASGEGLEFRMDKALRANTFDAHRLLVLAGREGCQIELKEVLMKAYFTDGRDVGELETLVELAQQAGLDPDLARGWLQSDAGKTEVAESLEFAASNDITGVPTYVFDRRVALPGAQPPETFARVLRRIAATDGPAQLT